VGAGGAKAEARGRGNVLKMGFDIRRSNRGGGPKGQRTLQKRSKGGGRGISKGCGEKKTNGRV